MQEILKNFIEDDKRNGLYLLPFPTGFGKTYQVVQYIANTYSKLAEGNHIFFLTSNLNNLPIEDLEKALGASIEESKDIIVVESYENCILNNFDINKIPEEFINDCVNNLQREMKKYKDVKSKYSHDTDYVKKVHEDFNLAENEFRRYIGQLVKALKKFENTGKEFESNDEVLSYVYNILKTNQKYKWIGEIYPNIFVKDYKIIVMTVRKFFTKNIPFFEPGYMYSTGEISDNALIFIDEFDATKNTINSLLIDESLDNMTDFIPLVERICHKVISYNADAPRDIKRAIEKHKSSFEKIYELAEELYDRYKVNKKYYCGGIRSKNFLFSDLSYHSVLECAAMNYAYVQEDKESNNMGIHLTSESKEVKSKDVYNLYRVIQHMNKFLSRFKAFVLEVANDYKEIKNSYKKPTEDRLTYETAIYSFLNVFLLSYDESSLLINKYEHKKKKRPDQFKYIKKKNSYYDMGMKIYEFINKLESSESTIFNLLEMQDTPEKIIANLALKAKVIGISATCNIDSVLCNYSLNYLKDTLLEDYHTIDDKTFNQIKDMYNNQNRKYCTPGNPSGQIKTNICHVDRKINERGEDISKKIEAVFSDKKTISKVKKKLTLCCANDLYHIKIYLSLAYVFKEFVCNTKMKSFLCLNAALPKSNSKFNIELIEYLFSMIIKEYNITINDNYLVVIKSGEDFDKQKKAILQRLTDGEKIFLMSSYATMGAGQNIPYKPAKDDEVINLNDEINLQDARNLKKDFDGIYLGEITHVITNVHNTEDDFTYKDLFNYLIQVENLYEHDEISYNEKKSGVKNAFKKSQNKKLVISSSIHKGRRFPSYLGYVTKQVIQAIGRLNRTFNKKDIVYIYISSSVYDYFNTDIKNKEIVCPEVENLCAYIDESSDVKPNIPNNNNAERVSYTTKHHISKLLREDWNEESIEYWKELRRTVLVNPTVNSKQKQKNLIFQEYYIHNDDNTLFNKYYFYEANDFSNIHIAFKDNKESAVECFKTITEWSEDGYIKECSYDNTRLEKIFRYPGLKDYFKDCGYAIGFKKNEYMMCPVLYQNIYKGAIGEEVGKYILENELKITLKELEDESFELFDFCLCNGVYIDFKHWKSNVVNAEEYLEKINNKLLKLGARKAYIINILDDSGANNKITETYNGRIVEVPYLICDDTYTVNKDIIERLRGELYYE